MWICKDQPEDCSMARRRRKRPDFAAANLLRVHCRRKTSILQFEGVHIMKTCTLPVGQLLLELRKHQDKLRAWVDLSEANTLLFVQDPAAALRAADLGVSEDLIAEVEETMQEIETFARRRQQLAA